PDLLPLLDGLHRRPRRDPAQQRHLHRVFLPMLPLLLDILRSKVQAPALVESALEVLLGFERRDVLVDRSQRCEIQPSRDLLVARTVPVVFDKPRYEVQHLLLPLGNSHRTSLAIVGEEKEKSQASTLALAVLPSPQPDD